MWFCVVWQAVIQLLLDPFVLLGLCAIQPLLEAVDTLCVFAQQRDIFVSDFVTALKVCEGQLYTMYVDKGTCYGKDELWAFTALLSCFHESIHVKWVIDLSSKEEAQLIFVCGGEQFWAVHDWQPDSRAFFADILSRVKAECTYKCSSPVLSLL
jgi:hypothetical protein